MARGSQCNYIIELKQNRRQESLYRISARSGFCLHKTERRPLIKAKSLFSRISLEILVWSEILIMNKIFLVALATMTMASSVFAFDTVETYTITSCLNKDGVNEDMFGDTNDTAHGINCKDGQHSLQIHFSDNLRRYVPFKDQEECLTIQKLLIASGPTTPVELDIKWSKKDSKKGRLVRVRVHK